MAKHKQIIIKISRFSWKNFSLISIALLATVFIGTSAVVPFILGNGPASADSYKAKNVLLPQTMKVYDTNNFYLTNDLTRDSFTSSPPPTDIASYGPTTSAWFTNDETAAIQWPFKVGVPVGDLFGPRVPPCPTCSSIHNGVDFQPRDGAQVQAIADGTVTMVQNIDNQNDMASDSYGSYVTIDHQIDGQTITSLYAHLQFNSIPLTIGQKVKVGDFVGKVGQTGAATGPHLHFELHVNGKPVDPMAWLKAHNN